MSCARRLGWEGRCAGSASLGGASAGAGGSGAGVTKAQLFTAAVSASAGQQQGNDQQADQGAFQMGSSPDAPEPPLLPKPPLPPPAGGRWKRRPMRTDLVTPGGVHCAQYMASCGNSLRPAAAAGGTRRRLLQLVARAQPRSHLLAVPSEQLGLAVKGEGGVQRNHLRCTWRRRTQHSKQLDSGSQNAGSGNHSVHLRQHQQCSSPAACHA